MTYKSSVLSESGVPQLVQPMIWDYAVDIDIEGKGLYFSDELKKQNSCVAVYKQNSQSKILSLKPTLAGHQSTLVLLNWVLLL